MNLKYALRRLAQNPTFFGTACVSLALGIGANTAAFSVVYAVLLHSLPVRDPASLAIVSTLMGLVALVLLIACVNVSNLMVARAERSHRETAISMALGATRLRLWMQSLLESLVIGTVGVTLGLVVAMLMRGLLLQLVPVRQELDVTMHARVFGASILLGFLTTIVLASVTARQSMRPRQNSILHAGVVDSRGSPNRIQSARSVTGSIELSVTATPASRNRRAAGSSSRRR